MQYGFCLPGNPHGPRLLAALRTPGRMGRDVIASAAERLAREGPTATVPADVLVQLQGGLGHAGAQPGAPAAAVLGALLSPQACAARLRSAAAELQRACGWR